MRLQSARLTPFRLALRRPLATARGPISERAGWLLELRTDDGRTGFGESSPLPGFGLEDHAASGHSLTGAARAALGQRPRDVLAQLDSLTPAAAAARAALDSALHDLVAQQQGLSVAEWLAASAGRTARARVELSALLVGADPRSAAQEARRRVDEGYRTLKLKLGADDFAAELARVRAVREALGPGVALRLDAGGAWKPTDVAARLRELARLDVELLEQPVAAHELDALAALCAEAPLPLAADEALCEPGALALLLSQPRPPLFVLKPAALGGLRAAWSIAQRAQRASTHVCVTSFIDSAIGRTSALHLAASLPEPALAAGLVTGDLLEQDLAAAPAPQQGGLDVPRSPGLGVQPDMTALRRCASGAALEMRA